jgi:hypothetical protein
MKAKRSNSVPDRSLKQNQISIRDIVKRAEQKGKNLGRGSGGGIFPRSREGRVITRESMQHLAGEVNRRGRSGMAAISLDCP